MLARLFRLITLPILFILLLFNLRRILFAFTILFVPPRREPTRASFTPTVLILVPCRDEERVVAGLCHALEQLDYPREKLAVVLIDDGSSDGTRAVMTQCARGKTNWHVLALARNLGKARALNTALEKFAFGEFVYVLDADHRPEPDALRHTMQYFADESVAGVSGRTVPSNPLASPTAYYSTVENYVHQLVTMRAKDRLDLAPALLGSNCGYRRAVLERCGGFRAGALLEDSDLTVAFYRAGYRIRFAPDAVSYHQVPQTTRAYLKQHERWARGFNDVARDHAFALLTEPRLSWRLRVELIFFASGYLDRLALLGAGIAGALSFLAPRKFPFPRGFLYFALLTPLAQIVALFAERRVSRALWVRLPLVPIFFALDIFSAMQALLDSLLRRARVWTQTERARARKV